MILKYKDGYEMEKIIGSIADSETICVRELHSAPLAQMTLANYNHDAVCVGQISTTPDLKFGNWFATGICIEDEFKSDRSPTM
eukprot:Awhi_evm1s13044